MGPEVPQAVQSDDPMVGSIVEGKYKILGALGAGGMATVYKAWHVLLQKLVALKFVAPEGQNSHRFRERFFREARIATSLVHPNAVQTREFGETADGMYYMAMDYCPGRSLAEIVSDEGPMDPQRAARILVQVLAVLHVAHQIPVVHRDVKPENIMVDDKDLAKVLDFGLAKILNEDEEGAANLTRAGSILGTPKYMSPEQALGQDTDHRSDVYSAGMVLYEILCGRGPFGHDSSAELIKAQIVETPRRPAEVVPGLVVPLALEQIVLKALAKEKEARWQTAAEFQEALESFLEGDSVQAGLPLSSDSFENKGTLEWPTLGDRVKVYRVRHKALAREGVLWVATPEKFRRDVLAAFTSRVDVTKRITHPALAAHLEAGAYAGERLYVFSSWREGTPLRERIGQGPMVEAEVVGLARPLLEALSRAHEFGVTHDALDTRLITLTPKGPWVAGLGVRAAAEEADGDRRQDVRDLASIFLQMLSGAHSDEVGQDTVRQEGLKKATRGFRSVLEKASGEESYANANGFSRALELADPRFAQAHRRSPLVTALVVLALMVVAALAASPYVRQALQGQGGLRIATAPGASVELVGPDGGARSGVSDASGALVLEELTPGNYVVSVRKNGHESITTRIVIEPEWVTERTLELPAKQQMDLAALEALLQEARDTADVAEFLQRVNERLATERTGLEQTLASCQEAGWKPGAPLARRVEEIQGRIQEVSARREALGERAVDEELQPLHDDYRRLGEEVWSLAQELERGKEAHLLLVSRCESARESVQREATLLRDKDRASLPAQCQDHLTQARRDWDAAEAARAGGRLAEAVRSYESATMSYSRATTAWEVAGQMAADEAQRLAQTREEMTRLRAEADESQRRAKEEARQRAVVDARRRAAELEAERRAEAQAKAERDAEAARREADEARTREAQLQAKAELEAETAAAAGSGTRETPRPRSKIRPDDGLLPDETFARVLCTLLPALTGQDQARVLLLHNGSGKSRSLADAVGLAMQRRPGDVEIVLADRVTFTSEENLRERIRDKHYSCVFVSLALRSSLSAITRVSRAENVLTVAPSSAAVVGGVALGIARLGRKAQIYVNLTGFRQEGQKLPRSVRRLAQVVER